MQTFVSMPPLGTLLAGRYQLLQVLSAKGFRQTYLAEDTQRATGEGGWRVIKQVRGSCNPTPLPSGQPHSLKAAWRLFANEAETLEKLGSHDQIPQLFDRIEENQDLYLVQEFIEGKPLSEELPISARSGSRWSEDQCVELLQDVLGILEFVHSQGLIHCDIKPDNLIRRASDGRLVLIDFCGVKPVVPYSDRGQFPSAVPIGTFGYLPAEQLTGHPQPNSDIYSLGLIGIQALTGLHPAQLEVDPDTREVSWRNGVRVAVSDHLAGVLSQMVRYDCKNRYQSAAEALQELWQRADSTTTKACEMQIGRGFQETGVGSSVAAAAALTFSPSSFGGDGGREVGLSARLKESIQKYTSSQATKQSSRGLGDPSAPSPRRPVAPTLPWWASLRQHDSPVEHLTPLTPVQTEYMASQAESEVRSREPEFERVGFGSLVNTLDITSTTLPSVQTEYTASSEMNTILEDSANPAPQEPEQDTAPTVLASLSSRPQVAKRSKLSPLLVGASVCLTMNALIITGGIFYLATYSPYDVAMDLLRTAQAQYQAGDLNQAIALAKTITSDNSAYYEAQTEINRWRAEWNKALSEFQEAEKAFKDSRWLDVVEAANQIPKTSFWHEQIEPILEQAAPHMAAAADRCLEQAYSLAIEKDFAGAIALLKKIPQGNGAYETARAKIADYSEKQRLKKEGEAHRLLQQAYGRAEARDFVAATALLQKIPKDSPTYAKVEGKIAEYSEKRRIKAEGLLQQAYHLAERTDYTAALNLLKQIPKGTPAYKRAQAKLLEYTKLLRRIGKIAVAAPVNPGVAHPSGEGDPAGRPYSSDVALKPQPQAAGGTGVVLAAAVAPSSSTQATGSEIFNPGDLLLEVNLPTVAIAQA